MSDSDEDLYVCGTARLSAERIQRLQAVVDGLDVRAHLRDGHLFIRIGTLSRCAERPDAPIRVRDAQAPEHAGSFLEGQGVDLDALPVEVEIEPRGRKVGDEVRVLFQFADAFAERSVHLEGSRPE